jgi:Mg/Co/Ni transporter MgtE
MKNGNRKSLSVFALFLPEIKELLERKDFIGIKNLTKTINSMDLAEGWGNLEPNLKIIIFKLLGTKKAVELLRTFPLKNKPI